MSNYVIGTSIKGLEAVDLKNYNDKIKKNGNVVIIIDDGDNNLFKYYTLIKNIIINGNRPIIIFKNDNINFKRQICALMSSYNKYDIYTVEPDFDITTEYVQTIMERVATEEEVMNYIGADVLVASKINEVIISLCQAVEASDIDSICNIINTNKDIIDNSVDVIDYMRKTIDDLSKSKDSDAVDTTKLNEAIEKIEYLESELSGREEELSEHKSQVDKLKEQKKIAEADKNTAVAELNSARLKLKELQEQLNNHEPVIKTYTEVQTSLIKCKVKSILYFKEVTYVRYVNSFITILMEMLTKYRRLKAKLIIYDNKSSFTSMTYKPLTLVNSNEYIANRDNIINNLEKLVVIEANPAIIEDILKADYDVVIVYDRLKQANDIVTGNNVYKYWVINSKSEYMEIQKNFKNINEQHIITRPGVFPTSIELRELENYKGSSASAKASMYMRMPYRDKTSGNQKAQKNMVDIIFDRANISSMYKEK